MASRQPGSRCGAWGAAGGRVITEGLRASVNVRSWAPTGQHRSRSRAWNNLGGGFMVGLLLCGLLSEAVQALLDRGVQGGGRVDRHTWGTNAGFPSSQSHSRSAPAVASTSGTLRSAGRKGSRSLQPSAPSGNILPWRAFSPAHGTGRGLVFLLECQAWHPPRLWTPSHVEPGRGASNDVPSLSLIFSSGVGADNETTPLRNSGEADMGYYSWRAWPRAPHSPGMFSLSSLPQTRLHSCGQPKLGCGSSLRPGSPTEGKGVSCGLTAKARGEQDEKERRRREGSRLKAAVTQRPAQGVLL